MYVGPRDMRCTVPTCDVRWSGQPGDTCWCCGAQGTQTFNPYVPMSNTSGLLTQGTPA